MANVGVQKASKVVSDVVASKKKAVKNTAPKTEKKSAAAEAKKTKTAKEREVEQEFYVEFNNEQILYQNITDKIKEAYKNEGHRVSSIKKLQVYMNISQRKAYYAINDKHEGKFIEF